MAGRSVALEGLADGLSSVPLVGQGDEPSTELSSCPYLFGVDWAIGAISRNCTGSSTLYCAVPTGEDVFGAVENGGSFNMARMSSRLGGGAVLADGGLPANTPGLRAGSLGSPYTTDDDMSRCGDVPGALPAAMWSRAC